MEGHQSVMGGYYQWPLEEDDNVLVATISPRLSSVWPVSLSSLFFFFFFVQNVTVCWESRLSVLLWCSEVMLCIWQKLSMSGICMTLLSKQSSVLWCLHTKSPCETAATEGRVGENSSVPCSWRTVNHGFLLAYFGNNWSELMPPNGGSDIL